MSDLNENVSLPGMGFYEKDISEGDMEALISYLKLFEKMIRRRDWDTVMAINSKKDI